MVLNRQTRRYVAHLLNRYRGSIDRPSFDDNAVSLRDIEIKLDLARFAIDTVSRAYFAPDTDLAFDISDGKLRTALPELALHAVLVFE